MLSIGQFSKACMVTVKTLRHYDKIGLLSPEYVNEENGYRFYNEEQIPVMLSITKLKMYGFSLADIKEILDCDSETAIKYLRKQLNKLHNEIEHKKEIELELMQHIVSLERTKNIMAYQNNYEIKLEKTEDMKVISNRQVMSVEDFGKYYGYLYKRCADKSENIILNGKAMAFYHDTEFDPEASDIELALGVAEDSKFDKIIEGSECAVTTHYGPYSKLPEAYGAVTKWIKDNNYKIVNAPYEIYIKSQFDRIPVDEWETKIIFPVEKA